MTSKQTDIAEFSRPVDLGRMSDREDVHQIAATPAEREALARRFGLQAIDRLEATARLRRVQGGTAVRLVGSVSADVVQSCVVTLARVPATVEDTFTILFSEGPETENLAIGDDPDMEWPEPMPSGNLDIGETVAQQLSLALDPYPRAPGAELPKGSAEGVGDRENPFAKLAALRPGPPSSGRA